VIAAHDGEGDHVAAVVEDLKPLVAGGGGEAGDHSHSPDRADATVAGDDFTALGEVFIGLRRVESAHHRPDGVDRSANLLNHSGAALIWTWGMGVVAGNILGDFQFRGSRGGG